MFKIVSLFLFEGWYGRYITIKNVGTFLFVFKCYIFGNVCIILNVAIFYFWSSSYLFHTRGFRDIAKGNLMINPSNFISPNQIMR